MRTAVVILLLAVASFANAGTVTLRPAAGVDPAGAITLGMIAELVGAEAERLAEVVVRPAGAASLGEIGIDTVRAALDKLGVNWGRLALRGSTCMLRPLHIETTSETESAPAPADEPAAVDFTGPATVRTRLAELLARVYSVEPADLRVRFDPADAGFLDTPEAGRRIEIQPAATPGASRYAATVWIYAGDRLLDSRTLRADVRLRRPVVVLTRAADRNEAIGADSLRSEIMWIEPTGAPMVAEPDGVVGSLARRRLDAGTILRTDALIPPIVVRRGELVSVHCVSGGVVVKTKARAQQDAREGERIELRVDGSKKSFVARVIAPGRAIVNIDAHQPDAVVADAGAQE